MVTTPSARSERASEFWPRSRTLDFALGPPSTQVKRWWRSGAPQTPARGRRWAMSSTPPRGGRRRPLPGAARAASDISENDSKEAASAKLAAAIEKLLPKAETEETTFYLGLLLGLGIAEQALQRAYLFFAARRYLECLASQPLLVVLEDLHWADSALLDLTEYLAAYLKDTPLVIIGLARPHFIDPHPGV